jgi:hypothetical protein
MVCQADTHIAQAKRIIDLHPMTITLKRLSAVSRAVILKSALWTFRRYKEAIPWPLRIPLDSSATTISTGHMTLHALSVMERLVP